MKKALKVLLWLVLGLAIAAVAAVLYLQMSGLPTYDPPQIAEVQISHDAESIANGAKIASMMCVVCHSGQDGKLSGQQVKDVPTSFGIAYSKNITQHKEKGIGAWSDGEIYHFLRTGLRADGTYAPPYMPKYPLMSDEDLKDIIAWLRSDDPKLQPSDAVPPPSKPSLLTKILCRTIMKPFPMPSEPIPLPDTTNAVAWGRYLADNVYACFGCHSADFKTVNDLQPELSAGYYGGGNPMLNMEGEVLPSANITPDEETGIGRYTEAQFVELVRTGLKPDGAMVRYPMLPHGALSESEVKAIYAFLRTVPPIKNAVPKLN